MNKKTRECLEDLFIFRRGQPVNLNPEAKKLFNMYTLVKKYGIKPWEYQMSYDDKGNPIVYKDDIDMLLLLDRLDNDGKAREDWLSSKRGK